MRKQLFRSMLVLLFVLAVPAPSTFGQSRKIASEERLVRQTYLKLSYLSQIARHQATKRRQTALDSGTGLNFRLENFQTGRIEEILDRPIVEFATLPTGEIVRVSAHGVREKSGTTEAVMYEARWTEGIYSTSFDPVTFTVGDALIVMGSDYSDVGKYASYDVIVSMEGKSRTYRALVLFHTPFGSSSQPRAEFWDSIVGMAGVLTEIMNDTRAPVGSPLSIERTIGELQVEKGAKDEPSGSSSAQAGITQPSFADYCDGYSPICCSPEATGLDQCCWDPAYGWGNPGYIENCNTKAAGRGGGGGGSGDGGGGPGDPSGEGCQYSFSSGMGVNLYASGATGHSDGYVMYCTLNGSGQVYCYSVFTPAGQHFASTNLHGECITDTNCQKRCNVVIDSDEMGDWGHTDIFYHVANKQHTISNDATGHSSVSLVCAGGVGYAVDQCITPWCSVSLTVSASGSPGGVGGGGGVTVSSAALWTAAHGTTHTCQPR